MIIQGKCASATVYANIIEPAAVDQIRRMCDYEFTRNSCIRIMPDVHAGKGCTIGTTMTVQNRVVPNIVGVDIGCGMYTLRLEQREIDFALLDAAAHYVPSGMNVWNSKREDFDLTGLRCFDALQNVSRLECSLGTLGGGNHFIEVDRSADGSLYLVIHTGSRNLGKQVAEYYQKLAIENHSVQKKYNEAREALIAEYRAGGRMGEIQAALEALRVDAPDEIPDDLCDLQGKDLEDYLHDVEICQRFARRSRELIASILMERANLSASEAFHTIHNYIDTDEMILRKGAIAAHAGEKVLIPVNMRDGSILAVGRGNAQWNYSAPHGAGRLMSRGAARDALSLDGYREAMKGVYTTSVNAATLDEAPMAYKSIGDIIGVVDQTVDVLDVMKPVYNFKSSD